MIHTFTIVGNDLIASIFSEKLASAGYLAVSNVQDADAVFVYSTNQSRLEDIYFETMGIIQTAKKNSYLIDLSPTTVSFAREVAAVAAVNDLHAIEAPICILDPSCEPAISQADNLEILLAGEEDSIEGVKEPLNALASSVRVVGRTGSAQLARSALTVLRSLRIVSCMEAEALFRASNASSDDVVRIAFEQDVVSSADLHMFEVMKRGQYQSEYTVEMWMAELTAALMNADDTDLIMPNSETVMHLLELLALIGGVTLGSSSLNLVYSEESACEEQGLNWSKAEKLYQEDNRESHSESASCFDDEYPEDSDYSSFGTYSSN